MGRQNEFGRNQHGQISVSGSQHGLVLEHSKLPRLQRKHNFSENQWHIGDPAVHQDGLDQDQMERQEGNNPERSLVNVNPRPGGGGGLR
jgi:hypothetical protein